MTFTSTELSLKQQQQIKYKLQQSYLQINGQYIKHSLHSKERSVKRAYSTRDIRKIVFTGTVKKVDMGYSHRLRRKMPNYTLHGVDVFGEFFFAIFADECRGFRVVTMGPATDPHLFGNQIVNF